MKKEQEEESEGESRGEPEVWCGLTLGDEEALVDTAAQSGLIGMPALGRLETALGKKGMRVMWIDKPARAQGVGVRPKPSES